MPSITPDLAAAIGAARALDCPACPALAGDECVYSTAPVSVPVVPGTAVRPVRGYHVARLDAAGADVAGVTGPAAVVWDNGDAPRQPDEAADVAGEIDATAAALLGGKITALREYVGRALGGERHGQHEALERVAAELARVSVILAAATEGVDDEDDDAEPYCTACGAWAGLFHGLEGWRHYRGEGTAASPVVLYDAGHEPAVAWTVPAGRSLSPADIGLIRQALADAHADDEARAASYDSLLRRLTAEGDWL